MWVLVDAGQIHAFEEILAAVDPLIFVCSKPIAMERADGISRPVDVAESIAEALADRAIAMSRSQVNDIGQIAWQLDAPV